MEKLKNIICCGENPTIAWTVHNEEEGYGILCVKKCGNGSFAPDKEIAITGFLEHKNAVDNRQPDPRATPEEYRKSKENKKPVNNNNQLVVSASNMATVFEKRKSELALIASPILSGDKTAMDRLMNNNTVRYPLTLKGTAWDKIWKSPEGQQSIIKGIEDALIMAAELGKMGDLVPFGEVCQFIPSVEAFEFSLTNGDNAPFLAPINIKCIYEGDKYEDGEIKGNFFLNFNSFAKSRKKVILVAVYGELKKSGIVVGEMYDAERLLEKAAIHSKPYANYLKIMKAYEYQKSEGNVKTDQNGRESFPYFEMAGSDTDKYFDRSVDFFRNAESNNQLLKEGNREYANQVISPTFTKKIYRDYIEGKEVKKTIWLDSLENPYAGADQPEMLRKAAGKSFLGRFGKVRNSEAAMREVRNSKEAMKESDRMANEQFEDVIDQEVD